MLILDGAEDRFAALCDELALQVGFRLIGLEAQSMKFRYWNHRSGKADYEEQVRKVESWYPETCRPTDLYVHLVSKNTYVIVPACTDTETNHIVAAANDDSGFK